MSEQNVPPEEPGRPEPPQPPREQPQPPYQPPERPTPPPGYEPPAGPVGQPYAHLGPTATGLAPNVAGLLAYLVGWVTGLIFLLIEPQNKFVRFHAMQSLIIFAGLSVVQIALGILSGLALGLAFVLMQLVWLVGLVCWIVGIVVAAQGKWFKFPIVGDYAMNAVGGPD
jgi:uncharacterized membrane protein